MTKNVRCPLRTWQRSKRKISQTRNRFHQMMARSMRKLIQTGATTNKIQMTKMTGKIMRRRQ